jgi:hypothetical protein
MGYKREAKGGKGEVNQIQNNSHKIILNEEGRAQGKKDFHKSPKLLNIRNKHLRQSQEARGDMSTDMPRLRIPWRGNAH